jgi:oligosaccharide repeat unit polymerase
MSADRLNTKNMFRNTVLFGGALVLMIVACLMTVCSRAYDETAACVLFSANVVLNIAIVFDLCKNIRRDFAMLVFVLAFDLLLLGRVYIAFFAYYDRVLSYLEADSFRNLYWALVVVTVALLAAYTAYKLAAPLFFRREKALREQGAAAVHIGPLVPVIRQISVFTLFFSSIAFLYMMFQTVLLVFRYGYLGSYLQAAEKSVPSIVSRMSMFFTPSFAVFLATMPDRKQMCFPLLLYCIYMLTSLLTGRRNTFVCEALMLIIYFVLRDSLLPKERRFLTKKRLVVVLLAGVVAVYFLEMIAQIRAGNSIRGRGFLHSLVNFVYSQGASFRVVIQTVNCWDLFDHQTSYHFLYYPFELYAHNNVLLRTIFGYTPISETQSLTFVSTTHNYAHYITFLVDPSRYLSGGGFGTSFVAEGYVAYGIGGVVVLSAMIGVVFRFFASMLTRSWVVLALCLLAIKDFVYIPRNLALSWVTDIFSITYLCYFVFIYFAALLLVWIGSHIRPARSAGSPVPEEQV